MPTRFQFRHRTNRDRQKFKVKAGETRTFFKLEENRSRSSGGAVLASLETGNSLLKLVGVAPPKSTKRKHAVGHLSFIERSLENAASSNCQSVLYPCGSTRWSLWECK